jgi:hypothetical protein
VTASVLQDVEEGMRQEFDVRHVPAQVGRFLGVFASTLGAQLLGGAHIAGWADAWSLLGAAAWTAWRQFRKTARQDVALGVVRDARAEAETEPAPTATS